MENKNPESLPSATTSEMFEEKCWGDESNFENPDPINESTTDIKDKDSGHKSRSVVKQICRFYISQNYCRYGRNCRFSHDRSNYGDNRNSERKYSSISLSGDLKTTRDSKHISNARRSIKKESETEVNQVEKSTGRIDRKFHGTSSSMNKYPDKEANAVRQKSDVSADLPYAYAKVEAPRQPSVMGRQRNLVFYRSNKETSSNSHAFRTQASNHCRYFVKGFCRLGDKCRFVHQGSNGRNAVEKTETKHADKSPATDERKTNEIHNSEHPRGHGVPVMRRFVKLQDLDTNEIMRLRNTEIQQLKKRFPTHEIIKSSPEEIFHVTVSPSDPDWSFAVNSVPLEVAFTAGYPREACTIKVLETNNLPPILVRHLNNCVNDWIKEKHEFCLASGKVELLFRPFLRWLDRNLEELFIVGLRKVKQDLIAREAGIEFVPYDELPGATSMVPVEINDTEPTAHPNENRPDDGLISSEEFNELDFGDKEQRADSNDMKHVQKEDEEETPVCNTFHEKEMTLISELQADYSSSSAGKENFFPDVNNLKFTSNDSLLVPANSCSEKFSVPKVGTEIKLVSLELTESAAAMVCTKIAVTLQCSRCKTRHEINTPPKRNNSLNCIKCHHLMQIVFQPAILHQFSTVMGYLHLVDCQAVDIPLMECSFNVDCLNCSKQISVSGIHYGQQRVTWCLYCNKKISVYTQSVKFHQLQPAPNIASTGHKLTTTTRKEKKVIKDPAIQEGKPLPDCGTCRHYKKSYRWLRFPCCGKAYPCDYCHDEKETDHEMKYANRMICGFCAKEQPYAGNKPCIICSSNMTKKAGSHWEGGKGCRDKITMSREDRQKYAGIGKTVSRKAQIQKPKKK